MLRELVYVLLAFLVCLVLPACSRAGAGRGSERRALSISSASFAEGGKIPLKHACSRYGGSDISPQLSWEQLPPDTASLTLVVSDPDARGFVHWLVYAISPEIEEIAEGRLPEGALQGQNSFGKTAWGGPCPPGGTHHYVFKLYALDVTPQIQAGARLQEVSAAMQGHILAEGELTGVFKAPQ